MAYNVSRMSRVRPIVAALGLSSLVAACAPGALGPPPGGLPAARGGETFNASDFAWSVPKGKGQLSGQVTYHQGATRFTCAGGVVILTPETAWSRRRMEVLYKSADRAALPSDE